MTLVIKVLLIRYALIIVEKRDEVYPQKDRRKKKILFFGFEVKTFIFFFLSRKRKITCNKRDWQYFCCDHIIIISGGSFRRFSEEREREREDEDESAEKDAREGKRFFVVEFDREVRRYNFHSYFTEIEFE